MNEIPTITGNGKPLPNLKVLGFRELLAAIARANLANEGEQE